MQVRGEFARWPRFQPQRSIRVRFEGATGEYDFAIVFNLATFQSTATIDGVI